MDHTLKAVDEELSSLAADVIELGALAVSQVRAAMDAFRRNDSTLGARIADKDAELDALDAVIERQSIRFIALRQPVADDLRAPITALKTAMNLERCGDLAKNIAKRVAQMTEPPAKGQTDSVGQLGDLVAERLAKVMAAYAAGDARAAHDVWARDEEIDVLHEKVFDGILGAMTAGPGAVSVSTHLLFMAKNLERIGDHATNIAEMVYYQITGQDLSGRPKH